MAVTSMWHIEVDRDRCMATRGCVHALPELFEIGDDDVVRVIGDVNGEDQLIQDVVAECPTAALLLVGSKNSHQSMKVPDNRD